MPNATNDFLPKDYEIPSTTNYMKLQDGVNRFRFLSKPIMGFEFWTTNTDGKRLPNRRRMGEVIKMSECEISPLTGKLENPAHFWAMVVWNYKDKAVQILELKQRTILEAIKGYIENDKWGSPIEYDITIKKSGANKETKYLTDHDPKEELDKDILKQYKDMKINLEALYDGLDPFKTTDEEIVEKGADNFDEFIKETEEGAKKEKEEAEKATK